MMVWEGRVPIAGAKVRHFFEIADKYYLFFTTSSSFYLMKSTRQVTSAIPKSRKIAIANCWRNKAKRYKEPDNHFLNLLFNYSLISFLFYCNSFPEFLNIFLCHFWLYRLLQRHVFWGNSYHSVEASIEQGLLIAYAS